MDKKLILNLKGGLGNQMFQYAFAYNIASNNGLKLLVDISYNKFISQKRKIELENIFNIKLSYASTDDYLDFPFFLKNDFLRANFFRNRFRYIIPLLSKKIINENVISFSKKYISNASEGGYINGYWQSYKYHDFDLPIHKLFKWNDINQYSKEIQKMIFNFENTVSVHFRRGDYLKNKNIFLKRKDIFFQLNSIYYLKSINYFRERNQGVKFFFFSEDKQYAIDFAKEYKIDSYFVNSEKSGLNDMYLMSLCRNNIIANSTFSWWGAYLNKNKNKRVLGPSKWFSRDNYDFIESLYPPDWVKMNSRSEC